MNLLIDIGNSRLKWALGNGSQLDRGAPIPNPSLNRRLLMETWRAIDTPERIGITSVGNPMAVTIAHAAIARLWPGVKTIHCRSQAHAFGVTNAYPQPEKLGADRWLSLIAAHHRYRTAVLIVDCGTAITLDWLAADGQHQGGMIAPGLRLMKQALFGNTQALPFSDEAFPLQPAAETQAAIYSGTLSAALGLIHQAMIRQADTTRLILSGGDAELIAGHLPFNAIVDVDLVLHGLAMMLEHALL